MTGYQNRQLPNKAGHLQKRQTDRQTDVDKPNIM